MIKPKKWYFQVAHFFVSLVRFVALKKSHHFWQWYQLGTPYRIFQGRTSDWRISGSAWCSRSHSVGFLLTLDTHRSHLFAISFQVIGFSKTNCCCSCSRYFLRNFEEFMYFSLNFISVSWLDSYSFFRATCPVLRP